MTRILESTRKPSFGRPTQQLGRNNKKPFNRPKPAEPEPPKREEKPKTNNQKKPEKPGNRRSERRGRPNNKPGSRHQKGGRRLTNQGGSPSRQDKIIKKPESLESIRQGITNQTGKRIGRRIVGSTGGQAVGRIIKGGSVIGKIQNAWELGTGIGGLGRGLLGIDDVNPYQGIPGFGMAELAWDLGDAIINPNSQESIPPNVSSENQEQNTNVQIISNSLNISLSESLKILNSDERTKLIIQSREFGGTTEEFKYSRVGTYDYYQQISRTVVSSGQTTYTKTYLNPDYAHLNDSGTIQHDYTSQNEQQSFGLTRLLTRITDLRGIQVTSWYTPSANGIGGSFWKNYRIIAHRAKVYWPDTDEWIEIISPGMPLNQGGDTLWMIASLDRWPYLPPTLYYKNTPYAHIYGYTSSMSRATSLTYDLIDPNTDKPIKFLPKGGGGILLREFKTMTCKALDAMKAMEQRINALEANLNEKLGENIEKIEITKTTIDANGEEVETKEEIELDGIGGTVSKILQNQYEQKESSNEEILKRLGEPIDADTELPSGETLAAAGIGIGGLAGLALLTQKKLGKPITKLPIYSNGGTPTNIIPNLTEADTDGIGGGIDRLNQEVQNQKHENDKKTKLDLRANLIDLLNLALNIHNAFSLSSTLLQTIVSFMNNVFSIFGLKDKDGNDIDIAELMGDTIQGILNTLIGVDNTDELIAFLKKSNRIIQTGSNVLFDLQGLTDSVRSISQQTGEYVAKIGNALRRNRIVPDDPEDSYNWMDEKMTPTSAFQKRIESISEELQNVTDFMGSLESVTSEVISAQEQFVSLKNNAIEFKNLVTTGENEKIEKEATSANESQSPEIDLDSVRQQEE